MAVDPARAQLLNAPLTSERLVLEPLLGAHADDLFDGMQQPAVYEWISGPPPSSRVRLRDHWARNESRLAPDGSEAWLAWGVRLPEGPWIGKCDTNVDGAGVATNVGYLLFPAFWGQGYASEVVGAIVGRFDRCGVKRMRATVTVGNTASERVLQKNGFLRTRILAANDVIRGVPVDDIEYVRKAPKKPAI